MQRITVVSYPSSKFSVSISKFFPFWFTKPKILSDDETFKFIMNHSREKTLATHSLRESPEEINRAFRHKNNQKEELSEETQVFQNVAQDSCNRELL